MEDSRIAAVAPDRGVPEALQVPTQPVRLGFMIAITIANMTYFLCYIGVGTLSLPFQIGQLAPASKVAVLSLFAATSVLFGLVTNPLAGAFSDRTTSRFGRRRPWIFAGALGTAVSLFIMWQAISLPLLYIGWCGVQLFSNFAIPAMVATIPDQVPERQRGAVSGVFGLSLPAGSHPGSDSYWPGVQGCAGKRLPGHTGDCARDQYSVRSVPLRQGPPQGVPSCFPPWRVSQGFLDQPSEVS